MKYLLDTDAFSDIVRGVSNVKWRFSHAPPSLVRISSVTVKEIEYGRRLVPDGMTRRNGLVDTLLQQVEALSFDVSDAHVAGRLRASLRRSGTPIGPYDVMIAGTALVHGLILVTANTREFSRVPGLQIENWRLSPEVREPPAEYRVARRPNRELRLYAPQ